ncbi:MAG TPA: DUF885 domain-containing protein [Streptosporangiaceae bacterium]|nr:DUF885 domain-containing protein [Streptosporangiaceae bacterium]
MSDADDGFAALARSTVDGMLERRPEVATLLGSHAHDGRLAIGTAEYHDELARWCGDRLADVQRLDLDRLPAEYRVDARILANQLELCRFTTAELREHEWNPMLANPGRAIYLLLARDFAPLPDRLRSVAGRLAAVPEALAAARSVAAGRLPRVHLETALSQFAGTERLIGTELDRALSGAPGELVPGDLAAGRATALDAIAEHRRWLEQRLADGSRGDGSQGDGFRDPRIGPELFARKLQLTLESGGSPGELLARAEADLDEATEQITETAVRLGLRATNGSGLAGEGSGRGELARQVLDSLAADAPDDSTILGLVRRAYDAQLAFVREHAIVTAYDDPVDVIEMPEIDRGVAIAYCDPPGPLETAEMPTFVAVSPTPRDWTADRVRSFYREYNRHMVQNLMVHEAMPGHVLQLGHARRFAGGTPVRAAFWSGSFVEGWAVYAEELMAGHGYPGEGNPDAVRMQQLKMRLRMIINTILDVRVHCAGLPEAEAMALMTGRGFQEDGEATGKWRRALLTSAQLSTYYVGYTEVADLAARLRAHRPEWSERRRHDELLAHGSPAARHLRSLLLT